MVATPSDRQKAPLHARRFPLIRIGAHEVTRPTNLCFR